MQSCWEPHSYRSPFVKIALVIEFKGPLFFKQNKCQTSKTFRLLKVKEGIKINILAHPADKAPKIM